MPTIPKEVLNRVVVKKPQQLQRSRPRARQRKVEHSSSKTEGGSDSGGGDDDPDRNEINDDQIIPSPENKNIFTDQQICDFGQLFSTFKKIHLRLINEGYVIKNGEIFPPQIRAEQLNNNVL